MKNTCEIRHTDCQWFVLHNGKLVFVALTEKECCDWIKKNVRREDWSLR